MVISAVRYLFNQGFIIEIDYASYRPFEVLIADPAREGTGVIVVIPCYNEPKVDTVLNALNACTDKDQCEVILLFNDAASDIVDVKELHLQTLNKLSEPKTGLDLKVHPVYVGNIDDKVAGVGMARRIGMDEAVQRFRQLGTNGIIACLDADCTVAPNYLTEIIKAFNENIGVEAFSIYYEHQDLDNPAIVDYELHLRCFIEWQRWLKLPFAFHTVGSSMAVRSDAYSAQGGMNKRKAGEDFYFFHKFTATGRAGVLPSTTVYPSARQSDRVPFGTGKAVMKIQAGQEQLSYHPWSYHRIRPLIAKVEDLYKGLEWTDIELDNAVLAFLSGQGIEKAISEARANTTSSKQFVNRFYRWMNAFRFMKYVHHMRNAGYPDLPVHEAAVALYDEVFNINPSFSSVDFLIDLRSRQKAWRPNLS